MNLREQKRQFDTGNQLELLGQIIRNNKSKSIQEAFRDNPELGRSLLQNMGYGRRNLDRVYDAVVRGEMGITEKLNEDLADAYMLTGDQEIAQFLESQGQEQQEQTTVGVEDPRRAIDERGGPYRANPQMEGMPDRPQQQQAGPVTPQSTNPLLNLVTTGADGPSFTRGPGMGSVGQVPQQAAAGTQGTDVNDRESLIMRYTGDLNNRGIILPGASTDATILRAIADPGYTVASQQDKEAAWRMLQELEATQEDFRVPSPEEVVPQEELDRLSDAEMMEVTNEAESLIMKYAMDLRERGVDTENDIAILQAIADEESPYTTEEDAAEAARLIDVIRGNAAATDQAMQRATMGQFLPGENVAADYAMGRYSGAPESPVVAEDGGTGTTPDFEMPEASNAVPLPPSPIDPAPQPDMVAAADVHPALVERATSELSEAARKVASAEQYLTGVNARLGRITPEALKQTQEVYVELADAAEQAVATVSSSTASAARQRINQFMSDPQMLGAYAIAFQNVQASQLAQIERVQQTEEQRMRLLEENGLLGLDQQVALQEATADIAQANADIAVAEADVMRANADVERAGIEAQRSAMELRRSEIAIYETAMTMAADQAMPEQLRVTLQSLTTRMSATLAAMQSADGNDLQDLREDYNMLRDRLNAIYEKALNIENYEFDWEQMQLIKEGMEQIGQSYNFTPGSRQGLFNTYRSGGYTPSSGSGAAATVTGPPSERAGNFVGQQ
jgi:hypothetical protein